MHYPAQSRLKRMVVSAWAAMFAMCMCLPTAAFALTEAECTALPGGRCATLSGCPEDFSAVKCAGIFAIPVGFSAEKKACSDAIKQCKPAGCNTPAEQNVGSCTDGVINSFFLPPCCSTGRIQEGKSAGAGNMAEADQGAKGRACNGRLFVVEKAAGDPPKGELKYEECPGGKVYYGDCYCKPKTGGSNYEQPGLSYQACDATCRSKGGTVDDEQGVGKHKTSVGGGSSGATGLGANALCFTPAECTDLKGTFNGVDPICPGGKGKCLAPEPTIKLSSPVLGQASVTGLRNYIPLMFNYALSISVVMAAIMFIVAGFKYVAGASAGSIGQAKEDMINATVGLVLIFGAQMLFSTINPDLLKLDKLNVYMINPQSFLKFNYCKDFKDSGGKPPAFGSTGIPAGTVEYDKASFDKSVDTVECNFEYYPQGFPQNKCMGNKCKDAGKTCIPCTTSLEECKNRSSKDYVCATATFIGKIHYENNRVPKKVFLMPVCGFIQTSQKYNSSFVRTQMPAPISMNLIPGNEATDSGDTDYRLLGDQDMWQKLNSSCTGAGNSLRGAVIGVLYKDPFKSLDAAAATAESVNKTDTVDLLLGGVGGVVGAAVGSGLAAGYSADDVLIVGKDDCVPTDSGKGPAAYFGYADGTIKDAEATMKTAFYCGSILTPGAKAQKRPDNESRGQKPIYWTKEELDKAFRGVGDPKPCNISLNSTNAPSNPGKALMGGCKEDWCFAGVSCN